MKDLERTIILKRFFSGDRRLYNLGKATSLSWFDKYDYKFTKDKYAYFANEEREEAVKYFKLKKLNDDNFILALNNIGAPKYLSIDRFVGKYYYFDAKKKGNFLLDNRSGELSNDVKGALSDTKNRAYYFLKAIIELHKESRWDKAYGGATWIDLLAKIRDLGGMYPAPRDIPIIKSYRIYYKTGSRRYPTHTIPEEMINTIKSVLKSIEIIKVT